MQICNNTCNADWLNAHHLRAVVSCGVVCSAGRSKANVSDFCNAVSSVVVFTGTADTVLKMRVRQRLLAACWLAGCWLARCWLADWLLGAWGKETRCINTWTKPASETCQSERGWPVCWRVTRRVCIHNKCNTYKTENEPGHDVHTTNKRPCI